MFRVGIAYALICWVLLQGADFAFDLIDAPNWVIQVLSLLAALGLPAVLIFAWVFEMTPEGIKRETQIDRSSSIAPQTGRKLDRVIIFLLVLAVAALLAERYVHPPGPDSAVLDTVTVKEQAAPKESGRGAEATGRQSVAVLPFIAMSNGPDDGYFADGLTEEILNSLAQLPELLVTARTSAFAFKNQDMPVQEIAAQLGVAHIVEGSVRRSGERLRVTAQLIRASDGFHLWSNNYDSTSADTIAVQEDIAEKIAVALNVVLDERKRERMQARGLRDVEAFIAFQKGIELAEIAHHGAESITQGLEKANPFFEVVLERVPDFSPAWSAHSDIYMHQVIDDIDGPMEQSADSNITEAFKLGEADYEKAIRFASTPAERAALELDLAYLRGNWQGMTDRMEKLLEQKGCSTGLWFEAVSLPYGYAERLNGILEELVACDPLTVSNWQQLATARLWQQDIEGVIEVSRRSLSVVDSDTLLTGLAQGLILDGQNEQAQAVIDTRIKSAEQIPVNLMKIAAAMGQREKASALLQQYRDSEAESRFNTLAMYAWLGDRESANQLAAELDQHPFGHIALSIAILHCTCGEPWDMAVTPIFAAKFAESGLNWPPLSPMNFPLKDW